MKKKETADAAAAGIESGVVGNKRKTRAAANADVAVASVGNQIVVAVSKNLMVDIKNGRKEVSLNAIASSRQARCC